MVVISRERIGKSDNFVSIEQNFYFTPFSNRLWGLAPKDQLIKSRQKSTIYPPLPPKKKYGLRLHAPYGQDGG